MYSDYCKYCRGVFCKYRSALMHIYECVLKKAQSAYVTSVSVYTEQHRIC